MKFWFRPENAIALILLRLLKSIGQDGTTMKDKLLEDNAINKKAAKEKRRTVEESFDIVKFTPPVPILGVPYGLRDFSIIYSIGAMSPSAYGVVIDFNKNLTMVLTAQMSYTMSMQTFFGLLAESVDADLMVTYLITIDGKASFPVPRFKETTHAAAYDLLQQIKCQQQFRSNPSASVFDEEEPQEEQELEDEEDEIYRVLMEQDLQMEAAFEEASKSTVIHEVKEYNQCQMEEYKMEQSFLAVSYTHLTLPTKRIV